MKWYGIYRQAQDKPDDGQVEDETLAPDEPAPTEGHDPNVIDPQNRTEQERELQKMFRDVGWKSPQLQQLLRKAPQLVYPLMQGIDQATDKNPGSWERAKGLFKRKELLMPSPKVQAPVVPVKPAK
jgi:hypothetical protein